MYFLLKNLSLGGKLIFISVVFSTVISYWMSVFALPIKSIVKSITFK